MSWGAAMLAALLIVLPRPDTWVVALASFLLRGGLLLFLLPIAIIPSPVELGTSLGPTITAFVLGGLSAELAVVVAAVFATFFGWLLIGGWVAAVTERSLIEAVAADEDQPLARGVRPPSTSRRRGRLWRILIVRLAGHVPLAAVLGWGSIRIVQATYRELTNPSDVLSPIAIRVVTAVPDAVVAIAGAWCLGEILGSLGARRLVLYGQSIDRAYLGAWADLLRRPGTTAATFFVPAVMLLVFVGPVLVAAGVAWNGLRILLATPRTSSGLDMVVVLLAFLFVWMAALVATGLVAAWRSAAATLETIRTRRTFGSVVDRQPGE